MTSEVQALLTKGRESRQAAQLLEREGYHDFAVSRAYYALFYAAEALLLARGLSFSSHAAVIAAFGREFAKPGVLDAKFHRWLIDAQDFRSLGDYGIGSKITAKQVGDLLDWAAEFLAAAEKLLSASPA